MNSRLISKLILAAAVAAAPGASALAQAKTGNDGTPWGFVAGLNMSSLTNSPSGVTSSNKTGFAIGVWTQYSLGESWAVQPELLYSMKGSELAYSAVIFGTPVSSSATISLNYLDLPVLLRYNLSTGASGSKAYLLAGPNIALKLSCSVSGGSGSSCNQGGPEPKSLDYGVTLGGGYEFTAGGRQLGVSARYQIGMAKVIDDPSYQPKNKNIQIVGTFAFK